MADDTRISIKVRQEDYDAAIAIASDLPLSIIDIFTAWRILWETMPEKQRMQALRKVRQPATA